MPARTTRRTPRAVAAGLATCAIGLAAAAPGFAQPAGPHMLALISLKTKGISR